MTKLNSTLIVVVLDRSGSMQAVKTDTIGGFNKFLEDQKKHPGEATITLTQFDDVYEVVYNNVDVKAVPPLTDLTYQPRGWTALLDAIGRTIQDVGNKLASMPEYNRPSKVIFTIITDGQENMSKEYNRKRVLDMITHQRDKYQWEFVYIGANQDAIAEGGSLGIYNSINYVSSASGTKAAFNTYSASISSYRDSASPLVSDLFQGQTSIPEDGNNNDNSTK